MASVVPIAGPVCPPIAQPSNGPDVVARVLAVFGLCVAAGGLMYTWRKDQRENAASLGFGYGVTERWFTEVYRKYESSSDEGVHFDAWEWENKFQLTEIGQYPVDIGLIVEIERPANTQEGYELRFGPLFQTEFGKVQLNGNLIFEQHYRSDTAQRAELSYQWQAKYRWQPKLEFGLQGFGDVGSPNHWDEVSDASHRMGPAVFGKFDFGNRRAIRYNAAWLFATSGNAPKDNFRAQIEYEF